jgi:hypothetical protein
MKCKLCMDKRFLCESCSRLTPWPCPLEHECYMACPQCNADGDAGGESLDRDATE